MTARVLFAVPLLALSFACAATADDSGAGGGAEGGGGVDFTSGGPSTGSGFDACATASDDAKLMPVNLYIMFDKSGSMLGPKWADSTSALQGFFMAPESAGLRVALRFFPDTGCDTGCSVAACADPRVPLGELTHLSAPTDAHEQSLLDAFAGVQPGGGTPLYAAYAGALSFAGHVAVQTPGEKSVVVLVTDGEPSDCTDDPAAFTEAAHQARVEQGVLTFAIALDGASIDLMNGIAAAGGTDAALLVGSGSEQAELLDALDAIRESSIACSYAVPESAGGSPVDPKLVNVLVRPTGATEPITLGQVDDAEACTNAGGWYYDDNAAPRTIHLCPSTCAAAQSDPGAAIELLFGCETVPA